MAEPSEHDVYIDLVADAGLLVLEWNNTGPLPATKLQTSFDQPLVGSHGIDATQLGVFKHLEFLAPGRSIPVFLDRSASWYSRRHRSKFTVKIQWRAGGRSWSNAISHDFRAFADLPVIADQPEDTRRVRRP